MPIAVLDTSEARAPRLRGWGRYVAELARALGELDEGDLEVRELFRDGSRRGPELVWEQWELPRRARRARARVLHAPNCFLPLRRPCPGVVTIHDLAFEDHRADFSRPTGLKYRALVPRAVRSAERVICDSDFTARDVADRYGVPGERLRVVPLAPALAPGPAGCLEAEGEPEPYLLGVGDLRAKKDFATLVRAWVSLRAEGRRVGLVLAGADAGQAAELRRLAGDAPLQLRGYVPDAELDALLRGAVALVHPSRYEGFGLVLLEAMARDTPVVAAGATALPETGGDAALYFPPGDAPGLAGVLRGLLDDPARRRDLVERGRARAGAFSWERTARETLAVYRELL